MSKEEIEALILEGLHLRHIRELAYRYNDMTIPFFCLFPSGKVTPKDLEWAGLEIEKIKSNSD